VEQERRALICELAGDSSSEAVGGAGDEDDLLFDRSHGFSAASRAIAVCRSP
jgi:hypothetical protein